VKKHLPVLLLVCLFACSHSSFALLRLGLKGGVNLANVSMDIPNQTIPTEDVVKPGFIIGAAAEVPVSPLGDWAVRAELLYAQKGTQHKIMGQKIQVSLDELVFCPFAVYRFPLPAVKPFLEAGPEFGWNVVDKMKDDHGSWDSQGAWKDNNLSLNVGAGVLLPLLASDLSVTLRYNLGLKNMGALASSATSSDITSKTNGIQLLLGYNFFKI
jgi:hypothetical protein